MGEVRREVRQELPHDLEQMPPGPQLAATLASVDRRLLDDRDRVRLVQARNRMVAHLQGELYADMYAVSWGEPPVEGLISSDDEPYAWTTTELAMALRWTKLAAGIRLEQARRMIEDLPAVRHSLRDGFIDVPKALVILDGVQALPLDLARPIVDQVLKKAPELTTGQLRVWLRRLVIAADPAAAVEAAKQHSKGRRVSAILNDNHLADLTGYDLAPHRVAASWERLTAIAKAAKAAGDSRSIDELRADALLDLVVGEGIALGKPVTNGSFQPAPDEHHDGESAPGNGSDPGHGADSDRGEPVLSPTMASMKVKPGTDGEMPVGARRVNDADLRVRDLIHPGRRRRPDQRPDDDRAGLAWPAAPADPSLLDPQADPPEPATTDPPTPHRPPDQPPPPQPPDDHQTGSCADAEHELLRPFWQAGFHQLPTTRPDPSQPTALPAPRKGALELHMSLYTLLGLDDLPAELAGFGPLLADIARQVARDRPDLPWKINIYDQGELLARTTTNHRPDTVPDRPTGRRTNRRPTTKVAEYVRARNRTCTRPGCRRHARSCELDHTLAWSDGGESEPNNLGPECTPDHHFKHSPGCQLIQSTSGGRFGWITPKGMRYVTTPDPPLYDDLEIVDPCR